MPVLIGGIVIVNCNVNVREIYNVMPISEEKDYHGSESLNVGKQCRTFNGISISNINDTDKMEGQAFTL
ncbi:spore germination protein [Bacillus cereus]|nr:spore germination protein [Bacillus cereus]